MVAVQIAAAALKAVCTSAGKAWQVAPFGSFVPAAWNVNEKVALVPAGLETASWMAA